MNKYNIHILTAFWKRPEITEIFIQGCKRLGYPVTASVSEENYIPICQLHGIDYVLTANTPLGAKWNAGLKQALKSEWDYLLILGSDDLISNCLIDRYMSYDGWDMIGVKDFYMYDIDTQRVKYFEGYNKDMSIGAGRLIKRKVIKKCRDLWSYRRNKGLDGQCSKRIKIRGFRELIIPMGNSSVVDIKSKTNMNSFEKITGVEVSRCVLDNIPEL